MNDGTETKPPRRGTTRWYQAEIARMQTEMQTLRDRLNVAQISARNASEERNTAVLRIQNLSASLANRDATIQELTDHVAAQAEVIEGLESLRVETFKSCDTIRIKAENDTLLHSPVILLAGTFALCLVALIAHQAGFQSGANYRMGVTP